ncbi:MAG: hypothetical protein PUC12_12415 [Clostridiales bacterium]|nr:hypothetical protein [Clostridiales bacterium]
MIQINFKELNADDIYQKNKLYSIKQSMVVPYKEKQTDGEDVVYLEYALKENQYGIFAHEYRNPDTLKQGGKSADIFACVVDERNKKIYTTILDVKHNISAFSDNLYTDKAMLTAIKNVREFVGQIDTELLHRDSLFVYYRAEGYEEFERIGIATTNFDADKFSQVADLLESLLRRDVKLNDLVLLKLKNSLSPYEGELARIKMFANKKVEIRKKIYDLEVFKLEQAADAVFSANIRMDGRDIPE